MAAILTKKDPFEGLSKANAMEAYDWLVAHSPAHFDAVQQAVEGGSTPDIEGEAGCGHREPDRLLAELSDDRVVVAEAVPLVPGQHHAAGDQHQPGAVVRRRQRALRHRHHHHGEPALLVGGEVARNMQALGELGLARRLRGLAAGQSEAFQLLYQDLGGTNPAGFAARQLADRLPFLAFLLADLAWTHGDRSAHEGAPPEPALAHGGTKPQRISRSRRVGSSSGSPCRLTRVATVAVGATL